MCQALLTLFQAYLILAVTHRSIIDSAREGIWQKSFSCCRKSLLHMSACLYVCYIKGCFFFIAVFTSWHPVDVCYLLQYFCSGASR